MNAQPRINYINNGGLEIISDCPFLNENLSLTSNWFEPRQDEAPNNYFKKFSGSVDLKSKCIISGYDSTVILVDNYCSYAYSGNTYAGFAPRAYLDLSIANTKKLN